MTEDHTGRTDEQPAESRKAAAPWLAPWPSDGLEAVNVCPACGSSSRTTWHDGLVDSSFRTAPGRWTLRRCRHCGSGYLDPRPDAVSLHLAYAHYYTHTGPGFSASVPAGLWPSLRDRIGSGYVHYRFGTRSTPASTWGPALAILLPLQRGYWNRQYRHLPRPCEDADQLLDVGCGSGDFLELASACGWKACGLDPDPLAAAQARQRGLPVLNGGLQLLSDQEARFDVITLSHVIEHAHRPLHMLRDCHRLLKPGGLLWLETPNVGSYGHRRFGPDWRGLETPRHLTVFSWQGLLLVLRAAGFADITPQHVPSSRRSMFGQSLAMVSGGPADAPTQLPARMLVRAYAGHLSERIRPALREFITILARRPGRVSEGPTAC